MLIGPCSADRPVRKITSPAKVRLPMDEEQMELEQQVFAYERYLEQRATHYGVHRDHLPYSQNLDLIVAQVNLQFGQRFTHFQVYQAISHIARRDNSWLCERGLRREGDVPLGRRE
jgi:hypothetical protein